LNDHLGASEIVADRVQAQDASEEEAVGVVEVDQLPVLGEENIVALSAIDELTKVHDVTRKAGDIRDCDESDFAGRHSVQEVIELVSRAGVCRRVTQVTLQRLDHARSPAPCFAPRAEVALVLGAADVEADLLWRRLANVDQSAPPDMAIGDLRRSRDHRSNSRA
jgi:hypothetical protein